MFEALKKKLKSFFKGEPTKPKKAKKEKASVEKKLKKIADKTKYEVPLKFEVGKLKYEPDIEAIKEKEGFFAKLKRKLTSAKITETDFDSIFAELEMTLLENNVALEAVDKIREDLKKSLVGEEIKKGSIEEKVKSSLRSSIESILKEPEKSIIEQIKEKQGTFVIVFFGINGSGKTTSLAKLAYKLQKNNISCVAAAADTFRAASIEQLETHAKKLNIVVIKHQYGSDPTAVAFDAKKYAEAHKIKCVLIDTAGRMYTKENLIKEMEKIIRVIKPDLKLFIGEAITGNDATIQARTFNDAIGIDGIILTKADVDDKGGTSLSVSYITGKPIYYLGIGQRMDDLKEFKKEEIIKHLGLD